MAKAAPEQKVGQNEFFGFDRVYQLHLEFSAKEWQAMQPADQGRFMRFLEGLSRPPRQDQQKESRPKDVHQGGAMEFPWARANLTENGRTYTNVGVRYKGNFTYMIAARQLKRSLKIEFDHYDKKAPQFHGLRKFNLHAGIMDPTKVHEALSYSAFRAAGVAAPRTAFAEITLTVPGKYDREYVGCYALIEQVDMPFLKDRFGSNQGLLMKPLLRGPDYLGDRWERYPDRYRPHREASAAEAQRIIAFAHLVNLEDAQQFRQQIDTYLDVDAFLRFLAVSAFLVNLDSPLAMPQNYYLYLHPRTHKFVFFPWDLDLSMAAWPFGGPPEKQMDLSLLHPHTGEHRLIDRLLAMPEIKERYLKLIQELTTTCLAKEPLLKGIDAIETATKGPLAKEAKAAAARKEGGGDFDPMGIGSRAPNPRTFVEKRLASVQAQLSGQRSGYVPPTFFGPGH